MIFLLNVPPGAPHHGSRQLLSFARRIANLANKSRVRITSGNIALNPTGPSNDNNGERNNDLVVMDDFIYGEPRVVK